MHNCTFKTIDVYSVVFSFDGAPFKAKYTLVYNRGADVVGWFGWFVNLQTFHSDSPPTFKLQIYAGCNPQHSAFSASKREQCKVNAGHAK